MQYSIEGRLFEGFQVMRPSADKKQFPQKEVKEFEEQLHQIQADLKESNPSHEGQSAEEFYAEKLASLTIMDGPRDGRTVVTSLLARCLLWSEIIQEK